MTNTDEDWSDWSDGLVESLSKYEDDRVRGQHLDTLSSVSDSEGSVIDISKINVIKTRDIFPLSDSDSSDSSSINRRNEESSMDSDDEPLINLKRHMQTQAYHIEMDLDQSDSVDKSLPNLNNDFADSDDEPLENLRRQNVSFSDSDLDSLYIPSDGSSCSDNEAIWDNFVERRRKYRSIKVASRTLTTRPRKCVKGLGKGIPKKQRHGEQIAKDMEEATRRSYIESTLRNRLEQLHNQRLQSLLTANNMQLVRVEGDGNCFMASVALQTAMDASTLRQRLCDYILLRREKYLPFVKTREEDVHANPDVFDTLLAQLRNDGCWLNDTADLLPLAVADMLNRSVKIFTSKPGLPLLNINPDSVSESPAIQLAYLATPGFEHYNAVEKISTKGNATQTLNVSTPDGKIHYTPRKPAVYKSPNSKTTTRKRKADPKAWKKTIRKEHRNSGQEYIDTTGKKREKRCPQCVNCDKCKFSCSSLISEDERKELCTAYWTMGCYTQQRQYILGAVTQCDTKDTDQRKRRSVSREYCFNVEGKRIRVCKNFFLKTLNIGKKVVYSSLLKGDMGILSSGDQRGKHKPHNKTPSADEDHVRRHIESFPVMESHYTRKDSRRRYLQQDLNIKKMYELYLEDCTARNIKPTSCKVYRRIFCEEYNLSFFVPKKVQCNTCSIYNQRKENGVLNEEAIENFERHQEKKVRARQEKEKDKKKAKHMTNFSCACFDLQSVLATPCSLVSQIYYKRKLNCYNFTVYDLDTKQASCYLWNESEGKRGANEIASCLFFHLRSLPPSIDHICFYSDCCSGQNWNQYVASAFLNAVTTTNIKIIDHKFLESGHTHMECDSVHATIEHAKKKTSIFVPHQWDTVIAMARKQKPYCAIPLKHWDFWDFKSFTKENLGQFQKDNCGDRVQWRQIRWLQYRKSNKDVIFFKTDFDNEGFRYIDASKRNLRGRRSNLTRCYSSKIPISSAKKSDLISLCHSFIIPEEFHKFYEDLPARKSTKTSIENSSEDEEY